MKELNKFELARIAYDKAISINPDYPEAYRNLSMVTTCSRGDPHFRIVEDLYSASNITDFAKVQYCFTLVKMNEDIGNYETAFKILKTGNDLRKKQLNYRIRDDEVLFNKLMKSQPSIENCDLDLQRRVSNISPIFIVGMPRSGTTLMNKYHPIHKVCAAGELFACL